MTTCRKYIERIRYEKDLNYKQIASLLEVTPSTVTHYRQGKHHFDDRVAKRVAEILDLDAHQVWMDVQIERNPTSPMTGILRKKYAELFGRAALYLLIFGGFLSPALLSTAGQCILC